MRSSDGFRPPHPLGRPRPPMRPVTSQVAAEIGYDPAGRDRSRALHPAGRRTPSRRRPPLGTPHQQHRPNQRRHRRLSGRDLPSLTPSASISYSPPIPPTPGSSGTPTIIGGDAGGASHYIPAYPGNLGISRILFFVRGHQGGGGGASVVCPSSNRAYRRSSTKGWCRLSAPIDTRNDSVVPL